MKLYAIAALLIWPAIFGAVIVVFLIRKITGGNSNGR